MRNKRTPAVGFWALHVGVLALFGLLLMACDGASRGTGPATTDTHSSQFSTDADKIAFARTYLIMPSDVEATEYHIVYHNNGDGRVPGPSDYDVQAVLKVAPADIGKWTDGLAPAPLTEDISWGYALLPNNPRWAVASTPSIYVRPGSNTVVAVFAPEGIVFKHTWTT